MHAILTLAIFSLSNSLFYLFPWSQIHGKFNTADIGLLVVLLSLFILLLASREKRILLNPISGLLAFQLLFCLFHIIHVIDKFDYSFFNAAVASRSFLFYLTFFVFLLLLDTRAKVVSAMRMVNILMLVLLVLSVINYFGPVIFHHDWGAGHYTRAGIKRAFIPGMYVLTLTSVWSFASMYTAGLTSLGWDLSSLVYVTAHIFRQNRMSLMGLLVALFGMGCQQRRFMLLGSAAVMVALSGFLLNEILDVDILGENVRLTINDFAQSKGTYQGRMIFIRQAFQELLESPIVGTGGSAIRPFSGAYDQTIPAHLYAQYFILGKQTDIGLFNWVKDFGLIGLAWIITFFAIVFRYARKALRNPQEDARIALFCLFYLVFVLVTSLTIEHFINSITIPPVMFVCAIVYRMHVGWKEET